MLGQKQKCAPLWESAQTKSDCRKRVQTDGTETEREEKKEREQKERCNDDVALSGLITSRASLSLNTFRVFVRRY